MPGDGLSFVAKLVYDQFSKVPYPEASFEGKTVIITGSNTGLGFEATKHIIRLRAAKVIMAVRSIEKGEAAKREIEEATGCDPNVIDVWTLDLLSYASVKSFAARVTSELHRVDVLLENAGIATKKWTWAEDNESTLTVNVVSTFLLAFLLLPKLKETATRFNTRPNLTIVTSEVHCTVDFKEKDAPEGIFNYLNDESKADMAVRYPTSKLLEVFFVREIAARRPRDSYPVTINMVNPGFCHSELVREGSSFLLSTMKYVLARTTEVGSRTLVHGASAGPETHGQYLNKCKVEEPATIVTCSEGPKTQQRVWSELIAKLEKIEPGISGNL